MKRLTAVLFFVCALLNVSVSAQVLLPVIKNGNKESGDIKLQHLSVRVEVVGNIATTTFDMVFYNSSSRVMEGEFEFPLGDGQTVSRYALDINGKLREGVVVEKEKGRKTFEEIARQGVDPGILEQTVGNNFRTRIYPFNAYGTRHVVIACEQELKTEKGKRYYLLPLTTEHKLKSFKLDVFLQNQALPVIPSNAMQLDFKEVLKGRVATFEKRDYQLKNNIVLEIPNSDVPSVNVENDGPDTYFYTFTKLNVRQKEKVLPKTLTILYDVSASAKANHLKNNLSLLKWYAQKAGVEQVRLVTFSYKVHTDVVCSVSDAVKQLQACTYDGATQLGCLKLKDYKTDEVLLFTDGIGNIGKQEVEISVKPLMVINSNNVANHSYLKKLAALNHGVYIDLSAVSIEKAQKLISETVYSYLGAKYDNKKVKEVYPSLPCPVGETFSLSGIMPGSVAVVTLYFGFGTTPTDSVVCEVKSLAQLSANNVKRLWAQKKLAELDMDYEQNEREIIALSKKYGVVTRNTSLIVLDRVLDYVRYEITPPDELLEEYNRLMSARQKPNNQIGYIPEQVYIARQDFLQWWKTDFKENKGNKKKKENEETVMFMEDVAFGVVSSNESALRIEPSSREEGGAHSSSIDRALQGRVSGVSISNRNLRYTPVREAVEVGNSASNETSATDNSVDQNSTINIQYWDSKAPYIAKLKSAGSDSLYAKYLKLKDENEFSPMFYIDVAEFFFREDMKNEAVRVATNLCELKLEDAEVARSCANKLVEFGCLDLAASVLENVVKMRSEEPQSYRDLALVYADMGELQKAADLLYKVGTGNWSNRFKNVHQIALNELNALIELNSGKIDTSKYDKKLLGNCPVDIRILLSWNTDNSDIDLWVTDPNGEKCYYQHNSTEIGGRLSEDITQGYGPEEFCLKNAKKGKYIIQANYYGSRSQKVLQPVVVTATVYTHFGTKKQIKQILTLQLPKGKDTYDVGVIEF